MRVFSVEMLVKEEGAATVQAALNRLKAEAKQVAAEMKVTTNAVTTTGKAMQTAATGTQIAGDRAAKAAIGFAAVGNSLARTGTLTADMGTRIIEAGSQISSMFGAGGLAVAALLGFAAAAATSFNKTAAEAKKAAEDVQKAIRDMVLAGDVASIDKRLRDVQQGILDITSGEFVGGLDDLRVEYDKLNRTIIDGADAARTSGRRRSMQEMNEVRDRIQRLRDLGAQIQQLEADEARLVRARQLAPRFATAQESAGVGSSLGPLTAPGAGTTGMGTPKGLLRSGQFEQMRKQIPELMLPILTDAEKAAVEMAKQIETTFAASISMALTTGIVAGIENAIATGNIGEGFKALSGTLLAGLGDAMIQFGTQSAVFANLMNSILTSLSSLIPGGALAASLAMIGIGAALKGVARGMFGGGSRGGGSASSVVSFGGGMGGGQTTQIVFGATSATAAAGMTPRQAMNVTIIGPNDPTAQRAMQELMNKANSRGSIG